MPQSDFDPTYEPAVKLPDNDLLLASAARFLIDGGEEEAASVLLSCALSWDCTEDNDPWWGNKPHYELDVTVIGPRSAYEILGNREHEITVQVRRAIDAVIPSNTSLGDFLAQAGL
jgi:hypothetical protein